MTENIIYKDNLKMIISRPEVCKSEYMVLFIHGGAWTSGNAEFFLKNMQYFEKLGIISASVDYRTDAEIEDCVEDCTAAVLRLKENAERLGFNKDRIVAFGDSAGAHIAAILGTPTMLKDKNAQVWLTVNCNAVCDLTGTWMGAVKKEKTFEETYKRAYEISPIWHVSRDNSPQIIVHGLKDTDVLPQDSLKYYYELKRFGVKSDIMLLPEEKHAFILFDYYAPDDTVVKIMNMITDKINEYLKDEKEN